MALNPFIPSPPHPQQEHPALSPSEVALQEIVKLQFKQTELSALIAEQQRISSGTRTSNLQWQLLQLSNLYESL